MTQDTAHSALAAEIARAVEGVTGVAFLRPGLAGRLRSALTRPERGAAAGGPETGAAAGAENGAAAGAGTGAAAGAVAGAAARVENGAVAGAAARAETGEVVGPSAGVRLVRPAGDAGPWRVEIHLVALRQARAVDVARATRRAVEDRLTAALPAGAGRARVTVTVTGLV